MALTAAQRVDVRRFMGFSVTGDVASSDFREPVYSSATYMGMSLDYRLEHLSAEEETVVVTKFLANLTLREQEVQDAASNLDTDQAAVWHRNKRELEDRRALFDQLRRDLCAFLGFSPGSALCNVNRLVRA